MSEAPTQMTRATGRLLKETLGDQPDAEALVQAFRVLAKWRSTLICNTILARDGHRIQSGPFAGMLYGRASEGALAPRLLGCYEASLGVVIEEIIRTNYPQVIDVGCAEGYYAVGLARRMPETQIYAFDTDANARKRCQEIAEKNGVSTQIQLRETCHHADFDLCSQAPTAVICDIEGFEAILLDPVAAPGLVRADILVETHPCLRPGVTRLLRDRFESTHDIEQIDRSLDANAVPDWMEPLSDLDRLMALWEWRGAATPWLWMKAKRGPQ